MNFYNMITDLPGGLVLVVSVEIFLLTLLLALPLGFVIAGVFCYLFNYLVAFTMERPEKRFAYYD